VEAEVVPAFGTEVSVVGDFRLDHHL
jgi:hypothetical protein